jgi:hypothetical protein
MQGSANLNFSFRYQVQVGNACQEALLRRVEIVKQSLKNKTLLS